MPSDDDFRLLACEKSTQTLRIYDSTGRLERVIPCTTGRVSGDKWREGDLKTPEGVYWFTRYISGRTLPPLYGAGALVMDYPNEFDGLDGKTGSGIWLHGVEANERVYLHQDTRGCVAVRNDHFDELLDHVRLGDTPILIVERLELASPTDIAHEARAVERFLDTWSSAWSSRDVARHGTLYAPEFRADGLRRDEWLRRKRELADRYDAIQVAWGDVLAIREKTRLWIRFRQEYASSGHRDVGTKVLRVRAEGPDPATWRIVGESWEPLADGFHLIDLDTVPMTPQDVARVAPDAAGGVTPAGTPSGQEGALPPAAEPPADPSGEAPAAAPRDEEPPAAAAALHVAARLGDAVVAKGTFVLNAPHARLDGGSIVVSVQLLSTTPWSTREGRWHVALRGSGAPAPDEATPFQARQGLVIDARSPVGPPGETPFVVTAWDAAGRIVLQQDVIVDATR